MKLIKIAEEIKRIDLDLVQKLKSSNMRPEYDKPLEEIGNALRRLYYKIEYKEDDI